MRLTAAQEDAIASRDKLPASSSPANRRVPARSRLMRRISPSAASATSILTELERIPMTAALMVHLSCLSGLQYV